MSAMPVVICRQRPGTAGVVVFMTLEDETGFVNAVIWKSVFQRYSVKTVSFLGITGTLQVEDGVVHIVAEKLGAQRWNSNRVAQPAGIFIESNSLHKPPAFFPREIDMIGVV